MWIQLFIILHINTTMHTYKINYYFYCLCISGHKFYFTSNLITITPPLTLTRKNEIRSLFWQRAMHDHCISENNHTNESLDWNAELHMNQNSSNEMASTSLYLKAHFYLASQFSLCGTLLKFSVSSEQFSGNLFFDMIWT